MQVWDIVSPADLTAFARVIATETPDPFGNTLTAILPEREVQSLRARQPRFSRTNVTAKFRSWNSESPIGERPATLSITEVQFPPISQKLPLLEADQLQLEQLRASGAQGAGSLDAMVEQVYDDVETNVRAIRNRMELARGDVIVDGKFTLSDENGLTLEADFGMPVGNRPTAATLWNAGGATPLTDEQGWILYLQNLTGRPVVRALTSLSVINLLRANSEYRSAYYPNASAAPNLSRAQLDEVRANFGLPPIQAYDHQLSVGGSATRVIPANRFSLFTDAAGETQWGITAEALGLARSGAILTRDAPGLVAAAYTSVDPVTQWTKVAGAGIPVVDGNAYLTATVS